MKPPPLAIPKATVRSPGRLQMPPKLYGRDRATAALLAAFEQVCQGHGTVLLVPGHSGVGKTALVMQVRTPVESRNGFFLAGKFNQYQQNVPYFAIRQALTALCRQLLDDEEAQCAHWRTELRQAVGNLGRLVLDLVPEFEALLGQPPPVADISPPEARHRFAGVLRELLQVVCRPEHPVVLFIDDWQWADAASLELLTRLQVDSALRYLLMVVSYRDNEVDSLHPLEAALEDLRRQSVPVELLAVQNLLVTEVKELLADTLQPAAAELGGVAALVHERTGGNPFFTRMFIEWLYEQGVLRFDGAHRCWQCRLDEHTGPDSPANVVELFARKIGQLGPTSRQLLSQAACLGNRFDLATLALISGLSQNQCRHLLEPGVVAGLIVTADPLALPGDFLFLHDRVQQAAYSFIPPPELPAVRLEIGRLLLAKLDDEQLGDRLFQILDHLNAGQVLIASRDEQVKLVALNLQAARKARAATAYRAALEFHRAVVGLLESPGFVEQLWSEQHTLTFHFFLERAECEFLEGDRAVAEQCVRQAVAHATGALEQAEALNVLIVQFTLQARYPEAIAVGREALAALGIQLPGEQYEAARDAEIAQVRQGLNGRPVAELFCLPVMSDPRCVWRQSS